MWAQTPVKKWVLALLVILSVALLVIGGVVLYIMLRVEADLEHTTSKSTHHATRAGSNIQHTTPSSSNTQHGLVQIQQVETEYDSSFLKKAEVIIVSEVADTNVTWGKHIRSTRMEMNPLTADDSHLRTSIERLPAADGVYLYRALLEVTQRMQGNFVIKVAANNGHLVLGQVIYGKQMLVNTDPKSRVDVNHFPPSLVVVEYGTDVELQVTVSSYGSRSVRAWRKKYIGENGSVTELFEGRASGWVEPPPFSFVDNVNFQSQGHATSDPLLGMTSYKLTISSVSPEDLGQYSFYIDAHPNNIYVDVDLVVIDGNGFPQILAGEPGILLTACGRGDAFDKGFWGLIMDKSGCVTCQIFGKPESKVSLMKDGLPLTTRPGYILQENHTKLGHSLTYTIQSASVEDLGAYECRAYDNKDPNWGVQRHFEAVDDKGVTVELISESVEEEIWLKISCEARGSPLPTITFYLAWAMDISADLVEPGEDYKIQHEQLNSTTVVSTLLARKNAGGKRGEYYCNASNMFTSYPAFSHTTW